MNFSWFKANIHRFFSFSRMICLHLWIHLILLKLLFTSLLHIFGYHPPCLIVFLCGSSGVKRQEREQFPLD